MRLGAFAGGVATGVRQAKEMNLADARLQMEQERAGREKARFDREESDRAREEAYRQDLQKEVGSWASKFAPKAPQAIPVEGEMYAAPTPGQAGRNPNEFDLAELYRLQYSIGARHGKIDPALMEKATVMAKQWEKDGIDRAAATWIQSGGQEGGTDLMKALKLDPSGTISLARKPDAAGANQLFLTYTDPTGKVQEQPLAPALMVLGVKDPIVKAVESEYTANQGALKTKSAINAQDATASYYKERARQDQIETDTLLPEKRKLLQEQTAAAGRANRGGGGGGGGGGGSSGVSIERVDKITKSMGLGRPGLDGKEAPDREATALAQEMVERYLAQGGDDLSARREVGNLVRGAMAAVGVPPNSPSYGTALRAKVRELAKASSPASQEQTATRPAARAAIDPAAVEALVRDKQAKDQTVIPPDQRPIMGLPTGRTAISRPYQ